VFVALRGLKADGASFAPQAAARGAVAVVAETPRPAGIEVPWLVTPDARLALARLADRFYGQPSRRMPVIGVTGTNGKTTTTCLLAAILDAAGMTAGIMARCRTESGAWSAKRRAPHPRRPRCSSCSPRCSSTAAVRP
jgi:UDP-N-acetylmuramoyl-L-alanyl-D-glutamate--2,6-diaminopimelate ligase